jgi:hypothetical protein
VSAISEFYIKKTKNKKEERFSCSERQKLVGHRKVVKLSKNYLGNNCGCWP